MLAHYFVPFPISQDNKAPSSDYYAVNYLPANGEGGAHAAYGGFLRDRPIGRAPLAGDWRLTDMKTEVDQAISGGIDGFTIDLLSLDGLNWDRTVRMMDAAAADGRGFVIVPQLDMTASAGSADPSLIASKLAELAAKPAQYRLADGRVVISAFEAEAKAPQWWSSLFAQLKSRYGIDVAFMPVFLNASDANIASFAPISYVEGNWGTRNPGNILAGPNYAAKAHAAGTKWMAPVSDQDERPNQGLYQEAANTETLRAGWQRAISDDADLVCVVAWNDYSEGTVLAPSVAHGRSFLDINAYYASWFTRGSAPKIAHDMLVVTHRIQPYAAKQLTAESKLMVPAPSGSTGTAPRDTAGVLAFLAAPATVTLRSGENSKTVTLPAGVSEVTVPLGVGTVSASAARGGATVASVTSPVAVTRTPVVQDLQYYASEVGHWW